MHLDTVRANAMKLSRNGVYNQGKVDVYFVPKKKKSYACYRQSMKLTNRIAAFQKVKKTLIAKAAEGRLSAPIEHFTCSIYLRQSGTCYRQSMKLTSRIAAFQKIKKN